jgi:hypothetical protein
MAWKTVFMDAHFLHIVISLPYSLWHHNQPKALATSEGCNTINTTSISMYRMARSLEGEHGKKHWKGTVTA